jgi:nucleotide-binding universal stress UspA family protein
MIELQRILFSTDFSHCADQAFSYAVQLAYDYKTELHVLHAVTLHGNIDEKAEQHLDGLEEIYRQLEKLASSRMGALVSDIDSDRVVVKQVKRRGVSVAQVILDYIADEAIDLAVIGTHGRRGLGHIVLGSVAEELVRAAPCPVLTVRELQEPRQLEAIERVLVPVDFSGFSRRALEYAKDLASNYQCRLQLLHIIEPPVYPSFYALKQSHFSSLIGDIEQSTRRRMRQLVQEAVDPDVPFDVFVLEGRAVTDIPDFAEKNGSDLIVIATHGLTGLKRLFLGSVTEKVVRRARCPVFTVRAFGKSLIHERST